MPKRPIKNEIAGLGTRDITQGFFGNILVNPDTVLATESTGRGLKVYEDLERDDKVYAAIQTRKNSVSGKKWQVQPASEDKVDIDIADFAREAFEGLKMGDVIKSLMDSRMKGFSISEILWEKKEDGSIGIKDIIGRDQVRFAFDLDAKPRLLTFGNVLEGEELPDRKFIVVSFGSKIGNPYGSGLGSRVFWPVWFKKNGVKFWSIFLDKFGSPTAIGKHPKGSTQAQVDKLLDIVGTIQQESAIVVPENMLVELLEANRTGSTDSYEKYMSYWDKAISIVILGQSLTTDVGGSGSRALGDVHNEVRLDLVKDDSEDISEALNCTLIPWLVDFNFPNVKAYPKFTIRHEPEKDLKPLAERDAVLVDKIGLPVSESYFYKTYDIPEPEEGDVLVGKQKEPKKGSDFARARGGHVDNLDPFVDRAMGEVSLDPIIDPIKKLVEEAESLEELKDKILNDFKGLDSVRLGDLLQQAISTAELLGRFEAAEEQAT